MREAARENNVKVHETEDGTTTYFFKKFIETDMNVNRDGKRVKADAKLDRRAWEALKSGLRDVGFLPDGADKVQNKSRSVAEDKDLLANSLKIMEDKEVLMTKVYKDFPTITPTHVVEFNVRTARIKC